MSGPSPLVTTCALVAIWPSPEMTKPEPRPASLLAGAVLQPRGDHGDHARRLAVVDRARVEAGLGLGGRGHDLDLGRGRLDRLRLGRPRRRSRDERGDGRDASRPRLTPGSSSANVVRPGLLSALSSPAMRSASSCAIASPSPDPCGVVGCVERLEDALELAAPDAGTEVGHREAHGAVAARRGDDDIGAGGRVAEGVVEQDAHDLGDAFRIAYGLHSSRRTNAARGATRARPARE